MKETKNKPSLSIVWAQNGYIITVLENDKVYVVERSQEEDPVSCARLASVLERIGKENFSLPIPPNTPHD